MTARFYIYRNLHLPDAFSVRCRGRVVDRLVDLVAYDVRFQVSSSGRRRAHIQGHKNVHAFAVARSYEPLKINIDGHEKILYNPFKACTFMLNDEPIYHADAVFFTGGRCYLLKEHAKHPPNLRAE